MDLGYLFNYIVDLISKIGSVMYQFWFFNILDIFGYKFTCGELITTLFPIFIVFLLVKKFVPLS